MATKNWENFLYVQKFSWYHVQPLHKIDQPEMLGVCTKHVCNEELPERDYEESISVRCIIFMTKCVERSVYLFLDILITNFLQYAITSRLSSFLYEISMISLPPCKTPCDWSRVSNMAAGQANFQLCCEIYVNFGISVEDRGCYQL